MSNIAAIKEAIERGELLREIYNGLPDMPIGYTMFTIYANRYCAREIQRAQGSDAPPLPQADTPHRSAPTAPPPIAPTAPVQLVPGPKVAAAPAQKKFSVSPVLPPKDQLV